MPVEVLSAQEREAWSRFPQRIEEDELGAFFTLTANHSKAIRRPYGDQNRLAVALQACTLRWLGFIPDDLWSAPGRAVAYLARGAQPGVELGAERKHDPLRGTGDALWARPRMNCYGPAGRAVGWPSDQRRSRVRGCSRRAAEN